MDPQPRKPPSNISAWCVALLLASGLTHLLSALNDLLVPHAHALFSFLYQRITHEFFLVPAPSIQWLVVEQLSVGGLVTLLLGLLAGKRLIRD